MGRHTRRSPRGGGPRQGGERRIADEAHDYAASDIKCESDDLEEGSQNEGLLKDLHWPVKVEADVYQSASGLLHRCVSGLSKSDADVDNEDLSGVADEAAEATADMMEETESLAVMQHVLGQSFLDYSTAAASEAKALALGLLTGLNETETDPEAERRQRLLLARHASDLPEVRNTPPLAPFCVTYVTLAPPVCLHLYTGKGGPCLRNVVRRLGRG